MSLLPIAKSCACVPSPVIVEIPVQEDVASSQTTSSPVIACDAKLMPAPIVIAPVVSVIVIEFTVFVSSEIVPVAISPTLSIRFVAMSSVCACAPRPVIAEMPVQDEVVSSQTTSKPRIVFELNSIPLKSVAKMKFSLASIWIQTSVPVGENSQQIWSAFARLNAPAVSAGSPLKSNCQTSIRLFD